MSSVKLLVLALLLVAATALAGCVGKEPVKGEPQVITFQGGEDTRAFDLEPIEWNVTVKVTRSHVNDCNRADCRLQEELGLREPSLETTVDIALEGLPKLADEMGFEAIVSNGEKNRTTGLFRGDDAGQSTQTVRLGDEERGKLDILVTVSYKGNDDQRAKVAQGAMEEGKDEVSLTAFTPGSSLFGDGAIDAQGAQRNINVTLYGVWSGSGFAYEAWLTGAAAPQSLGFFNFSQETQSYELSTNVPAEALKSFTIEVTLEPKESQTGASSGAVVLRSVFVG